MFLICGTTTSDADMYDTINECSLLFVTDFKYLSITIFI